jgi:hypothetical protein
MSRFAKLNTLDRRARLDIEISESGQVSGRGGSPFIIANGDENFVLENEKSEATFYLFGYQFDTSALRTFLRSTSSPQGLVTQEGKYVFGSAGTQFDKRNSGTSQGIVNLSLRRQWIIGINQEEMLRLADGVSQVNAELVVYLEPLEKAAFDEQLSALDFEIAAASFSDDLVNLLMKVRELSLSVDNSSDSGDLSVSGDVFTNVNIDDPFATSSVTNSWSNDAESENSKRSSKMFSRKNKKLKSSDSDEDVSNQYGGSALGDFDDPYA